MSFFWHEPFHIFRTVHQGGADCINGDSRVTFFGLVNFIQWLLMNMLQTACLIQADPMNRIPLKNDDDFLKNDEAEALMLCVTRRKPS